MSPVTRPLDPRLVAVLLADRTAPYKISATREHPWRIRKIDDTWYAWPQQPGVYARMLIHTKWLRFPTFDAALAEVLRRLYSK